MLIFFSNLRRAFLKLAIAAFLAFYIQQNHKFSSGDVSYFPVLCHQELFFDMSQSSLRGNSLKLNKKRVRLDVAKFSFSTRVVNEWNILDEIISGCSLAGFKLKLDHHLRDKRGYI